MKSIVVGGLATLSFASVGFANLFLPESAIAQSTTRTTDPPVSRTEQRSSSPRTNPSQTSGVLRATLEQEQTLYLDKDKTYDYDLILRSGSAIGSQRLPVGTIIRGQFEPAEGGLVYVANSVEIADRIYPVRASSDLIRDRKDPRQTSTGAILTDAAIGAAGGYILGEVFGDADLWEIAGGAAAGVLVGNTTAPFVVVIKPEDMITLFAN